MRNGILSMHVHLCDGLDTVPGFRSDPSTSLVFTAYAISTHCSWNGSITLYPTEMPFNTFANRDDPDQAALVRAALSRYTLFAYGFKAMIGLKDSQSANLKETSCSC